LGNAISVASDPKLNTTSIKLCASPSGSKMKSDDFMTDEIVPWGDVLGDSNGRGSTVEKIVLEPFATAGFPASLVDLEPLSVSLVELVAGNGATRSHVCQLGTSVVRPLAITSRPPVKSNGIAWIDIGYKSSWSGIGTACNCGIVGTLVRILRADLPNDAGVGGATYTVTLEDFALDGNTPRATMGGNVGGGEEGSEEECGEFHCIARRGTVEAKGRVDQRKSGRN
jgi:hypothetical protein